MAEVALVAGVGPGLGSSLARRFAQAGMWVAIAARHQDRLAQFAAELATVSGKARAYHCDVTNEQSVQNLFAEVKADLGGPNLVVFNAGTFVPKGLLDTRADEFERCWRVGCFGGFLVGRAAVSAMLERGDGQGGTVIFTGATASLRGSARFHNLAVGKFGLRALAQSMAREFQPSGVHVAHIIIDGQIRAERPGYTEAERGPDAVLDPDAIAEAYYQIYRQPRSAWTHELDLRPWVEKF
jgi:NAD(P)-dependent dehydrogenase (short-subunit alcohol dehydrogenase family)